MSGQSTDPFFKYLITGGRETLKIPRVLLVLVPWLGHIFASLTGPYSIKGIDFIDSFITTVLLSVALWLLYRGKKERELKEEGKNKFTMRKKLLVGVSVLIVLLLLPLGFPPLNTKTIPLSDSNAQLEYYNEFHGYSIQYPANYLLVDSQALSELPEDAAEKVRAAGFNPGDIILTEMQGNDVSLSVFVKSSPDSKSFGEFADTIKKNIGAGDNALSEKNIKVGKEKITAIEFSYETDVPTLNQGRKPGFVRMAIFGHDDRYFLVGLTIPTNVEKSKYLTTYSELLDSFTFSQ